MATRRLIFTLLAAAAVGANALAAAAAAGPCCCVVEGPSQSTATVSNHESVPSCCAERAASAAAPHRFSPAAERCDCAVGLPAVPATRDATTKQTVDPPVACLPSQTFFPSPVDVPAIRRFEHSPGAHAPSGPALLALLCVWLK